MSAKIKENHWLPKFLKVEGITFNPYIFLAEKKKERLVNHEMIHIEQYKECGFFGFLSKYVRFWFKDYLKYKSYNTAYMRIPFEKEAYENQRNLDYIKTRKEHAWKDYI